MNVKTTITLLVILVALLGAILLMEGNEPDPQASPEPAFPDLTADDVSEMTWWAGDAEVAVRRVEGGEDDWTVTVAGLQVPASDLAVAEVLNDLKGSLFRRTISGKDIDASKRQEYGLEPPHGWIRVMLRGEERKLYLGEEAVSRDTVYAHREGDEDVFLMDDDLLVTLREMSAKKLRATRFTELTVYDVDRVEVRTPEGTGLVAIRSKEDSTLWQAESPFRGKLDPEGMEADLVPAIIKMEATDFISDAVTDDDLGKYGLSAPRYTVTIRKRGTDETRTLLVGSDVPEKRFQVYFMAQGEPFVFAGRGDGILEKLARDPASYRDRNLTRLGWKTFGRFEAKHGEVSFEIEREHEKWQLEKPEKMTLDQGEVEEWIDTVRDLSVAAFLDAPDLATLGLEEPSGSLTFWRPKEQEAHGDGAPVESPALVRILIGSPVEGSEGVYAMRAGEPATAFEVGPELLRLISPGHFRFKKRVVFDVDPGQRDVLRMKRVTGPEDIDLEKKDGSWPEGVNAAWVSRLLASLLDLSAVRWVGRAEGHEAEYGLAEGLELELRFTLVERDEEEAEPKEFGVAVGAETEGGRYARAIREGVAGPDVFVISQADLDRLAKKDE